MAETPDRLRPQKVGRPALKRGEIIAFRIPQAAIACAAEPNAVFVKRIIGLPGETVGEKQGYVYIDGRRLAEPYVDTQRRDSDTLRKRKIAESAVFVLGDNRTQSCDSRYFGALPAKNVIARVVQIVRGDQTIDLD